MIVARQFIAWNHAAFVPSRRVRSDPNPRLSIVPIVARLSDPIIPCPTGRFPLSHGYQAINCLATIMESLRDKTRAVPQRDNNTRAG